MKGKKELTHACVNELERTLVADSYAASPSNILEALSDELAHTRVAGAPHSIYEEVWHLAFWQDITLEWLNERETPYPSQPAVAFPDQLAQSRESWTDLRLRFLDGCGKAASIACDQSWLDRPIHCPSPPGKPTRTMTVREQVESWTAHNAYHLGRIVLLRQLLGAWPPPSGGFTW